MRKKRVERDERRGKESKRGKTETQRKEKGEWDERKNLSYT